MRQYLVSFYVDGRRTEQVVSATSTTAARELIQAQYAGHRLTNISIKSL